MNLMMTMKSAMRTAAENGTMLKSSKLQMTPEVYKQQLKLASPRLARSSNK